MSGCFFVRRASVAGVELNPTISGTSCGFRLATLQPGLLGRPLAQHLASQCPGHVPEDESYLANATTIAVTAWNFTVNKLFTWGPRPVPALAQRRTIS